MISIALIAFLLLFSPMKDLETENARLRVVLSERIIVEMKLRRAYEMQMFINELEKL